MPEPARVGYVLKAYPRASEIFITSEIHRLEQAGVPLRLFVIKQAEARDLHPRHAVLDRITAQPEFLTVLSSMSETTAAAWLSRNGGAFLPALRRVVQRRPLGTARALAAAGGQIARTRNSAWRGHERKHLRELLLAIDLSDRLLRDAAVQHLHAHYAHGTATVAWLASLITGLSFSFTGHARDIYCEELNPAGLLGRKLRAARFAVTCTEANRTVLQAIAPTTPVHRLYHGLNADFARLLQDAAGGPPPGGTLRILGVGRLVAKKGFDVLLEAAALLRRRRVPVAVTIVGPDGGHAGDLRRQIGELGLEDVVELPGPSDQAGLRDAYRAATVFCLPCRILDDGDRDGIPNVLMEAMACRVPVVSTRISGIPELVADGANGLLVPPNDAEALAAALQRLHQDPALADRLARAGQATVAHRFDGDHLASQLATLFQAAIA